jgi:hypothetical protein
MRRLYGFANWLVESILQQEATLRFSNKYPGQNANKVPPGFWKWVQERMKENPKWTPAIEDDNGRIMSHAQVVDLINTRVAGKPYRERPVVQEPEQPRPSEVKPEPQARSLSKEPWILAKVVNVDGLQAGEHVVLTKSGNGTDWILMTRSGATRRIPATELRTSVASIRDERNVPVMSLNPEELWAKVPATEDPVSKPEETPVAGGVNPHILDKSKLSDEQREIDEEFEMINALAGTGKAQPLDSLLLTPNGWIKMGEIKVDDEVFGSDGLPHKVIGVFPQGVKGIVKVEFTDGSTVECCEDHLWLTETKKNRDKSRYYKKPLFSNSTVLSTKEIAKTISYKGYPNHYIPLTSPLQFPTKEVPIDPYLFGVLLGDGSFRTGSISFSTKDSEILESVNDSVPCGLKSRYTGYGCDYRIIGSGGGNDNPLVVEIKKMGLWKKMSHEKNIPDDYKFNSPSVRLSVLQGLLDTDGDVSNKTNVEYNTTSKQLADDVKFLVESLGGIATTSKRITKFTYNGIKKNGKLSYRLNIKFPVDIEPFRLARKKDNYTPRQKYQPRRAIKSVKFIGNKECQCISVNSQDNLYVTNNLVLTHNTTILKHLAWKYGKPGQKWLYLVFNTKNRIEAKEKFPTDWVKVYTTNSFLGHVMKEKENIGIFPQTERITSLNAGDGNRKLEKARIMVESSTFNQMMTEEYHLPEWDKVKNKIPEILKDFGVRDDRGGFREAYGKKKRDKSFFQICLDTLEFITNMIRRNFQERVLTLLGLLKSFSVDPRKKDKLNDEVRRVFDKYDVASYPDGRKESGFFDTFLTDIKERIEKYSPNFQSIIKNVLSDLLHYNFMSKNYKEEVISAATWMLQKTMPKATDETFEAKRKGAKKGMVHNLGDYRDFNDDIWFPTIHADEIHFPHYDVVLADEVQDFNEGQKIMLKKLAEAGAKIVAVGDPNQAIYRFRGADNDAFNNLANMLKDASHDKEGWKPKTLSLNYRSRPEVLQYANERTHVKNLKPGKKFKEDDLAPEVTHGKVTYEESFDNIAKERSKGTLIETAYISRTNEPLVHAALKLLGKGIPFVIVGKDVSGDLVKHVDKIVREEEKARRGMNDGTPIMQFQDSLLEFEEKEVRNKSKYATQADYLSGLRDTTLAIRSCIDQFTNNGEDTKKSLGDFKKWLAERLGGNTFDFEQSDERAAEADLHAYEEKLKKEKPVILTTAHKSKGLEFARVYVLRDDQMPHPKAKHPEELAQEGNTKYVAYTRAMHQLHNLALKGQPGV